MEIQNDHPASATEVSPATLPAAQKSAGRTISSLACLPEKTLLDETALASALCLSKRTIRRMVSRNELPPPFRFAGKSNWMSGKVLAHIEARADRQARDAERAAKKMEALV